MVHSIVGHHSVPLSEKRQRSGGAKAQGFIHKLYSQRDVALRRKARSIDEVLVL